MRRLVLVVMLASCSGDDAGAPPGPNAVELASKDSMRDATDWSSIATPRPDRVY